MSEELRSEVVRVAPFALDVAAGEVEEAAAAPLDVLMKAAHPLVSRYLEAQDIRHAREIGLSERKDNQIFELEKMRIEGAHKRHEGDRNLVKMVLSCVAGFVFLVIVCGGYLIVLGEYALGVQVVVGVVT